MECLEHIMIIKANSSSIVSGATWNKIYMMVFMLVLLSQYLEVLLILVLLQVHAKNLKLLQVLN
jgi:hypothetical protein